MNKFDYATALNKLNLDKSFALNDLNIEAIPKWVQSEDFVKLFLPYLQIIGDSREQDCWIKQMCDYYGISYVVAKKDKGNGVENLKEGDYTFKMVFGDDVIDYTGIVAYERKGSISEFYNNCTGYNKEDKTNDRDRLQGEFNRFADKKYKKVVLLLEFSENLTDLIGLEFQFRGDKGKLQSKNVKRVLFATVMSWKQPNNKNFDILQSKSRKRLFWLFIQDCYYYFRNDIRKACEEQGILKNIKGEYKC